MNKGPFRPGLFQTGQAPPKSQRPEHPKRDAYDWITLWAAIFGVAVVALSTVFTAYQALITKRQLDAAISKQRPWVRLQLDPFDGVAIDPDGAKVPMRLTLTNVGQVPAIGVRIDTGIAVYAPPPGFNPEAEVRFGEFSESDFPIPNPGYDCDDDIDATDGRILFPGESVSLDSIAHLDPQALKAVNSQRVIMTVLACVVYYRGSEHHHTQRALIVLRTRSNGVGEMGFLSSADHADVAQVQVLHPPWGNQVH